jgi:uroporphyrin-3 C-methyltransferase
MENNLNPPTMETEPQKNPPSPRKGSWLSFGLSLLAILFSVLTFLWFFYQNHQQNNKASLQLSRIQQNLQDQDNQLSQQEHQSQQLALHLQRMQQENQRAHTTWVLAEVSYLSKLALYNLMYENNPVLAGKLLETADQRLLAANSPGLQAIRQAIANNIVLLNGLPKIDTGGLIARINALSQQIENIPLIPSQLPQDHQNTLTQTSPSPQMSLWQRLWNGFLQTLKEMLIIRRHQSPVEPLITTEQRNFLIQNIQLKLSLAQWAILHQQTEIYQQSLQEVYTWISRYFLQNASTTQAMLQSIKELQRMNVKPNLPNLEDIFTAIENFSPKGSDTPVLPDNSKPGEEAISS